MSNRVCHFKLVLLGDTAVGKSCLVVRFVRDEFFEFQEPTIGAAFLTQTVALDDATVKFEIWDTAGQERYRSLAPMYYRGAAAAIVVYDITNPDSFAGAKSWVKELQRRGDQNVVIALRGDQNVVIATKGRSKRGDCNEGEAGNKADLESRRKVAFEEANAYAEENGILHLETSAKNANNVKTLFVEIAKKLPKNTSQPEREAFPIMPPKQDARSCC
eukprot:CAMPEP_0118711662 /NCGR_PEP_ID=MMETSP0800-20121206/24248_1 /TAXON_ID=210618 ORGANISM="Striatella unipunctata, Strain CCMP2910" /NCGR_SAMPLE_ID=MMETSP0800 /ASSEMBLY_ACC=CAM_ASM_000638 /LENGTH=216 /DNA_ID=CAMNT_0006616353 /DNA_START=8 /DNA_END=659 /DNA_ORIENTATION=+